MSTLKAARNAQWPLMMEFTLNFNDTMADINGVTRDFGSLAGGSSAATIYTFTVANLPQNATVIGGHWVTETAFDTAGYDVTVGDTAVTNRYLATNDLKATALTALVPTGYRGAGENIVITVSTDDACTTGKATLRLWYTIQGRSNEVQTN